MFRMIKPEPLGAGHDDYHLSFLQPRVFQHTDSNTQLCVHVSKEFAHFIVNNVRVYIAFEQQLGIGKNILDLIESLPEFLRYQWSCRRDLYKELFGSTCQNAWRGKCVHVLLDLIMPCGYNSSAGST